MIFVLAACSRETARFQEPFESGLEAELRVVGVDVLAARDVDLLDGRVVRYAAVDVEGCSSGDADCLDELIESVAWIRTRARSGTSLSTLIDGRDELCELDFGSFDEKRESSVFAPLLEGDLVVGNETWLVTVVCSAEGE